MDMEERRPNFLPSALEILSKEAKLRGWRALVPFWFLGLAIVGAGAATIVPAEFWSNKRWDISTAVYAGLLTLNGIITALGWSAFLRMYDVIYQGELGKYIAKNNLLKDYLTHITFIHMCKIFALFSSAVALVIVLVHDVPTWLHRVIFGVALTSTMYAIRQAMAAIEMMHDLMWQSMYYSISSNNEQSRVTPLKKT